jgi:hypothetical protein
MKKTIMFLLSCSMILSLFGCKSQNFQFTNIDGINDLKCIISISSLHESEEDVSNGIDDGSGDSSTIIEDPVIKEAYSLISENCVSISEFQVENEDTLLYITFCSGDIASAKTACDGITHFGSFVITKTGKFIAKSTPNSNKSYYYQGDEDLYNKIMAVIAGCRY